MILKFNIYIDFESCKAYYFIGGDKMIPHFHLNRTYFTSPRKFTNLHLLQIGRMFCQSATVIEPHIHTNLYELTIVTDGEATIYTNDIPTKVQKGDIYLSFPGDIHKIESDKANPLKYDFFAFRLINSVFSSDFDTIAQDYSSPTTRVFHNNEVRYLIGNAIAEIDSDEQYSEDMLNSVFNQILIYVIRGLREIKPRKSRSNATRNELLCYRLMNYIDTHIYTMKNLDELSAVTDYSYGYLSALFKETTSGTLSDYFKEKKLDAARLLLIEGRMTVTEISELLNYSSVYAFSKAFKEQYGISPKNYIK